MKTFIFKMFTRVSGLQIEVGRVNITAKNYDDAAAIYRRKDLPFHHFGTVEIEKENNGQGWQPKTGKKCGCRRGIMRDNCPACEGTGYMIDFAAIRARNSR